MRLRVRLTAASVTELRGFLGRGIRLPEFCSPVMHKVARSGLQVEEVLLLVGSL